MMYGRGKSDSVVIAEKPTNKAGQLAAELMDRSGDRGECAATKHVPGTGPGKRVPSVGPHTTSSKTEEEGEVHRAPAERTIFPEALVH